MGAEDTSSELWKPTIPTKDECFLLYLPPELRERIYSHIFATTQARCRKHRRHHDLAILQSCTQVRVEASSVLYDRNPLRFVIGHRQVFSSDLPPSSILDRFQNISFKLVRMGSTHPSYEFDNVWKVLAKPFINSDFHRRTCSINCELEEFAGRSCRAELFALVKFFTGFDTLSITYEGKYLKKEHGVDGKPIQDSEYMQRLRSEARQREFDCLSDVEKMLRWLEKHLGEGNMVDVSQSSKALYARKLVFFPLRNAGGTPSKKY